MSPSSPHLYRSLSMVVGAVLLCVGQAGCDSAPEPARSEPVDPVLAGLLADGGDETRDLPCPGASEAERKATYHPKVLRGEILASVAAADPEQEQPLGGAAVTIRRLGEDYEPVGEIVVSTTSDDGGRYCLRIPEAVEFGAALAVVATAGDLRLRRLALDRDSGRIAPQSEAIVALLAESEIPPFTASYEELVNLQTLAATAVDLMATDGEESEDEAIASDPRVGALVEQMRR